MGVNYTASKGQPHLIPSGSTPDFAGDTAEVIDWFVAGRTFRKFATQAALNSATGMADNDLAMVDTIDGGWFKYDGSATLWRMHGRPRFADTAARDSAITAPVAGWECQVITDNVHQKYIGSAWVLQNGLIRASTVSATGGTIANQSNNTILLTSVTTSFRIDIFPTGYTAFEMTYDLNTSAAATLFATLSAAGVSAATNYDTQADTSIGTTAPASSFAAAGTTLGGLGAALLIGRHTGVVQFYSPNVATLTDTEWRFSSKEPVMTAAAGHGTRTAQHRTTTAYDGIIVAIGSGNVSGTISVKPLY